MSNSASSSPIDGNPKANALTQALQQSRSNQGSPVAGPGGIPSRFNESPRSLYGSISSHSAAGSVSRDSPTTTPRHNPNYPVYRNQTTPLATKSKTESPPSSAASLAIEKRRVAGGQQQQQQRGGDGSHMLRTSSMDSTMSTMSSNTTVSQSSAQADGIPSSAEIASMIASAGSAENLIKQLLREKRNAAVQNNQLFKLLNKQKTMMQGMHIDLERALADKERYRSIAQSLHVPVTPDAQALARKASPAISASSVPSSSSQDRLPLQRLPDIDTKTSQEFSRSGLTQGAAGTSVTGQSSNMQQPESATSSKSSASLTLSEAADPRRNTVVQVKPSPNQNAKAKKDSTNGPISPRSPPQTPKTPKTPRSPEIQADSTPASFTARRSMTQRKESFQGSSNPASPTDSTAASPSTRKAPPAPLVLQKAPEPALPPQKSPEDYGPGDHSDSDYDEIDVDELPRFERGRKKTREEDDLEREVMMIRAQRASESAQNEKSRSKSSKKSQKSPPLEEMPQSPNFKGFSPPSSAGSFPNGQAASLAGMLSPKALDNGQASSIQERVLASPPLKSPGLPMSPRPQDRPMNAAMPRQTNNSSEVTSPANSPPVKQAPHTSPRAAPTGPLPQPPMSAPIQPKGEQMQHSFPVPQSAALQSPNRPVPEPPVELSSEPQPGTIYRGLMSDAYPELLLSPNALPSILVKVTSSRLRPSRQSTYGARSSSDDSVFTLGVFARSNQKQLWRVEKAAVSLVSLEHQLKQVQPFDVKVPDRQLFSGHAPARVDARRAALETFFEDLLDTHMNEKAAVTLCRYFSMQVIPAEEPLHQHGKDSEGSIKDTVVPEMVTKEGYLTKKGKNFGGWKARYFVLNEPVLRYYESPGGSLLGTIKLTSAQIGRQSSHKARSPSRGRGEDDVESQYRHAFLIMEPKRNNSNSQLQHVLCAESDVERDEWVEALMFYLGKEPETRVDGQATKATPVKSQSGRENKSIFQNMMKDKKDRPSDASDNPPEDALRGVSYKETTAGQAPMMGSGKLSSARNAQTPPPSSHAASASLTVAQASPGNSSRVISGPRAAAPIGDASTWGNRDPGSTGISGPTNGAVITDASAWGNKDVISAPKNAVPIQDVSQWGNKQPERRPTNELKPPESPRTTDKEVRKRSFWGGFRGHSAHGSTNSAGGDAMSNAPMTKVASRAVFGIPLAEAVEFCMAPGSTTPLPSVVHRCLEYLEARGAEMEEGIFRISGSTLTINKLKERFNTEGDVNLLNEETYFDVHAVASLLKLYLRELPERVLTNALYPKFVAVQELSSDKEKVKAFNELVHKLPLPNWTLVQSLCRFLIQVDAASELSKMTVRNLCIVFAPTLNLSNPIITLFLRDFHDIFDKEPESAAAGDVGVGIEVTAPSPRTPNHLKIHHEPSNSGLGLQYEDVLQLAYGLNGSGTADDSSSQTSDSTRATAASGANGTLGGPEYGAVKVQAAGRAPTGPGLSSAAGGPRDMKQKRRESSMLMMNFPAPGNGSHGLQGPSADFARPQRKSSLPLMRDQFE